MFSLVIAIIAIALVALLALAAMYYGADALNNSSSRAASSKAIAQTEQILGAAELFNVEQQRWSNSVQELIDQHYLKNDIKLQTALPAVVLWTQPKPGHPTYWAEASTDMETCRLINLQARGDNGIYNKARPGLVTQCFGAAAPFTTITTRVTDPDPEKGLKVVFDFLGSEMWGYDPTGGGWSVKPTQVRYDKDPVDGGEPPVAVPEGEHVTGGSGGGPALYGEELSLESLGALGLVLDVPGSLGAIPAGGSVSQTFVITNTSGSAVALGGSGASGSFKQTSSTCADSLAPGMSCAIIVTPSYNANAVPADGLQLSGTLTVSLGSAGYVRIPLSGYVRPAASKLPLAIKPISGQLDASGALMFPDTPVGKSSSHWIQVTNVGPAMTYDGEGYRVTSPYSVTSTTCGGSLPIGEACTVQLTFTPTAETTYAGPNYYYDVLANTEYARLLLSGRGVPAGPNPMPGALQINNASTTLTGSAPALSTHLLYLSLINTSSNTIQPGVTAVVSGDRFELDLNNCPISLAANAGCTVRVKFSPTEIKAYEGKLTVMFTGSETPLELDLQGLGTNPLVLLGATGVYNRDSGHLSEDLRTRWELNGSTFNPAQLVVQVDPEFTLPEGVTFDPATFKLRFAPGLELTDFVRIPLRAVYQGKLVSKQTYHLHPSGINTTGVNVSLGSYNSMVTCRKLTTNQVGCSGSANANYGGIPGTSGSVGVSQLVVSGMGTTVVSLDATDNGTCGVTSAGRVLCWGKHLYTNSGTTQQSQLTSSTTPVGLSGIPAVTSIAMGTDGACGLTPDGYAWCWGSSTGLVSYAAVQVYDAPVKAVEAFDSGVCVVTLAGQVLCRTRYAFYISAPASYKWFTPPGLFSGVESLKAAGSTICGITTERDLKCWGAGIPAFDSSSRWATPYLVASNVKNVFLGMRAGNGCVVTMDNRLECWGSNTYRQFTPVTASSIRKTDVTSYFALGSSTIEDVSVKFPTTCVYTKEKVAHCRGTSGQITNAGFSTTSPLTDLYIFRPNWQ